MVHRDYPLAFAVYFSQLKKKTLFIDEKVLITETQPTLKIVYPVLSVEEITW